MRSSTVLPVPEGPNTTTISPALTDSETSSSTLPDLNPLEMLRSSRLVIASPLHRAEGQAFDQVALRIERQEQGRRDRQHDRRRDLSVLDAGGRHERERADRHWLLGGGGEDQREYEIVPREDEGQQAGGRNAWPCQRNRDLAEGLPPAVTRDAVGMLDVRADVLEIAAHDPQDQRQADQLVDPDQA